MTTFSNVKRGESRLYASWSRKLCDYIRDNPVDYPLSTEELMNMFGLKYDAQAISDYHELHSYLQRHRKYTIQMMEILFLEGHFKKYVEEGVDEQTIYQNFIDKCLSFGIVPFYSDADGKYKLIDLKSFFGIMETRLKASGTELVSKMKNIKTASNVLPQTTTGEIQHIRDDPKFDMLKSAKENMDSILLPEKKQQDDESEGDSD